MPSLTDVYVTVRVDGSNIDRDLRRQLRAIDAANEGSRVGKGFTGGVTAAFKGIAVGLAGAFAGAAGLLSGTVGAASDLGESVNAVKVTFGDAAKGVLALGDNAATAVGLSRTEFNGLAVQFSSFASTIAGSGGNVTGVLGDLTTRAADFASVMNLDVNEATGIFQSALSGETEPIRAFGIDLSAAAVQAFAAANGIGVLGQELTEGEKIQARYALLMQETSKTQGDFANTSDSLANRQRILGASFENIKASIGVAFLPALESAAGFITDRALPALEQFIAEFRNGEGVGGGFATALGTVRDAAVTAFGVFQDDVIPALQSVKGFIEDNRTAFLVFGGALAGGAAAFGALTLATTLWSAVTVGIPALLASVRVAMFLLNATMAANPIGIVIVVLGALVGGLIMAYKQSETFREIVNGVWAAVRDFAGASWTWLKANVFQPLGVFFSETLPDKFNAGKDAINGAWQSVQDFFGAGWQWIKGNVFDPVVRFITGTIPDAFRLGVNFVKGMWDFYASLLAAGWNWIKANVFTPIAQFMLVTIPNAFRDGVNRVKFAWDFYRTLLGDGWNWVKSNVFQPIGDFITRTIPGWFTSGVDAIGRIWGGLRDKVAGPIDTMKRFINDNLRDPLNALTSKFGLTLPRLATGGPVTGPQLQAFADGGLLRGPGTGTSDSILGVDARGVPTARVSNGEYVIRKASVDKYGPAFLNMVNEGRLAGGGVVGGIKGYFLGGLIDSAMNKVNEWLMRGVKFATDSILTPARSLISAAVPEPEFANKIATGAIDALKEHMGSWAKKRDEEAVKVEGPPGGVRGAGIGPTPGGGSQANLMAFAARMISMGARVSEHPAFGRVGRHSPGSKHYVGRAVDVNYGPGGQNATEMAFFDRVVAQGIPRQYGLRHIWRAPGHFNHLHADYDQGGYLNPGMTGINRGTKPERVLTPAQTDSFDRLVKLIERGGGPQQRPPLVINAYGSREDVLADRVLEKQRRLDALYR